jgi:hypothetical protein
MSSGVGCCTRRRASSWLTVSVHNGEFSGTSSSALDMGTAWREDGERRVAGRDPGVVRSRVRTTRRVQVPGPSALSASSSRFPPPASMAIRLVTFDALYTLLEPRAPIAVQYADVFRPYLGPLNPADIHAAFKSGPPPPVRPSLTPHSPEHTRSLQSRLVELEAASARARAVLDRHHPRDGARCRRGPRRAPREPARARARAAAPLPLA